MMLRRFIRVVATVWADRVRVRVPLWASTQRRGCVGLSTRLWRLDRSDRSWVHGDHTGGSGSREISQEHSSSPAARLLGCHTHLLSTEETL